MRIQLQSDLHLEFYPDLGEAFVRELPVVGDVLVIAGDLLPLRSLDELSRVLGGLCQRFPQVVFVPGNHEYYRTRPALAEALLRGCAAGFPNLHVLNGAVAEIAGVRFVGATLWYPESPGEELLRGHINDFLHIEGFLPWGHETHAAHLAFLSASIRPGDVVVTHYVPHPASIPPRYADSPLNPFILAADAAALVERAGARLWIHGHTHTPCDHLVGNTRVICNPRGYPREQNAAFRPGRVVEI